MMIHNVYTCSVHVYSCFVINFIYPTVECEHLKEPLFSNEEGQLVKFKVKALMQVST